MTTTETIEPEAARNGPALGAGGRFGVVALCLVWAYVCMVFWFNRSLLGMGVGYLQLALLVVGGWVAIGALLSTAVKRGAMTSARGGEVGILATAILVPLFIADIAYSVYAERRLGEGAPVEVALQTDVHLWHGEVYPRAFYPTERNFQRFKPGVRISTETFGEFYQSKMLDSPTLRDSVLTRREVTYEIDEHGFRNTTPLDEARIFVLGDSFAMGFATAQERTWPVLLESSLGMGVYNLGMSGTGPRSQLLLLQHLLAEEGDLITIDRLVWMIFEGNDLENSYDPRRPASLAPEAGTSSLDDTILESVRALPFQIQSQSLIDRWRTGRLHFTARNDGGAEERRTVDGIRVDFPLFHSDRWGYRLFNAVDMQRAGMPRSYVTGHRHRAALDETFGDMKRLSETGGFPVTVVLAPTAARVHGPQFDGFPRISDRPYFLEYVSDLAAELGFDVVDLVPGFSAASADRLLYYRDDHHWNPAGNELAAALILAEVTGEAAPAP